MAVKINKVNVALGTSELNVIQLALAHLSESIEAEADEQDRPMTGDEQVEQDMVNSVLIKITKTLH